MISKAGSGTVMLIALLVAAPLQAERPSDPGDGQTHRLADGTFEAWDAAAGVWRDPVSFWLSFAERRGGLTWGRTSTYPPYGDVNEHDTILIEVGSGPCLMEFFHRRWRRANDVWRWADEFNAFGGCPDVFD